MLGDYRWLQIIIQGAWGRERVYHSLKLNNTIHTVYLLGAEKLYYHTSIFTMVGSTVVPCCFTRIPRESFLSWTDTRKNHYKSLNMDEYGQRICPSNKHHLWSSIHTWQRQETHLSMGCLSIRLNEYAVIKDKKVMMPIVSMSVLPNGILKHKSYTHLLAGYSYYALVVYYGWN